MKKTFKILIALVMAALTLFALAIPAAAETEFEFESSPNYLQEFSTNVGKEITFFQDDVKDDGATIYSKYEDILQVEPDGTVIPKKEGTGVVAVVYEDGNCYYYKFFVKAEKNSHTQADVMSVFEENSEKMRREFEKRNEDEVEFLDVFLPILLGFVILLVLAEITYIFITAPKFGMSRWWAVAPIVGNVFGLIVFLVLKTAAKQNSIGSTNVIICPTCNGRHPYGTSVCSICGTKLGQ